MHWERHMEAAESSGPIARIITLLWLSSLNNEPANHHVVARLHKARVLMLPRIELVVGAQIVHFHKSNSGHVVYAAHDRGVVTRLAGLR